RVLRLPEEDRAPDRERDQAAETEPRRPQDVPSPPEREAEDQPSDEQQDRLLVEERDADGDADREPEAPAASGEGAKDEERDHRPPEEVVDRRAGEVPRDQEGRDGDG